jgi:hypothetical protein
MQLVGWFGARVGGLCCDGDATAGHQGAACKGGNKMTMEERVVPVPVSLVYVPGEEITLNAIVEDATFGVLRLAGLMNKLMQDSPIPEGLGWTEVELAVRHHAA